MTSCFCEQNKYYLSLLVTRFTLTVRIMRIKMICIKMSRGLATTYDFIEVVTFVFFFEAPVDVTTSSLTFIDVILSHLYRLWVDDVISDTRQRLLERVNVTGGFRVASLVDVVLRHRDVKVS